MPRGWPNVWWANLAPMANFPVLMGSSGDAALDWVLGAAASIAFVALIAIPATALNVRDRKRRRAEQGPPPASP
jgi:ABC-type spermidine/putrescine transport system permease subunit I